MKPSASTVREASSFEHSIAEGVLVASTSILLFIPVVYYEWMKDEKDVTIS